MPVCSVRLGVRSKNREKKRAGLNKSQQTDDRFRRHFSGHDRFQQSDFELVRSSFSRSLSYCLGCADLVWAGTVQETSRRAQDRRDRNRYGHAPKPRTSTVPSKADRTDTPHTPMSKRSRLIALSDEENVCGGSWRVETGAEVRLTG